MEQKNIHENLEQDIERLSREVERLKGIEGEKFEKKKIIKKSFESFSEPSVSLQTPPKDDEEKTLKEEKEFLPDYLLESDGQEDVKLAVEHLLDMVFHKGLQKALDTSRKADPFVQDAFHDALVDKLLPILEERGML